MTGQLYVPIIVVTVVALLGLVAANALRDRGVPSPICRSSASMAGGAAFLLAVLWLDAWTAAALAGSFALVILALRLGHQPMLRGVQKDGAGTSAEITYALAGALSLSMGWAVLGDRWLALLPVSFLAWGDGVAGMIRAWLSNDGKPWPSIAMLAVCLGVATLFQPYWIGACGALAATAAERLAPRVHWLRDDNLAIVAVPLLVMAALTRFGA